MKPVVVKIGGGTLENPSIAEDLVQLQKEGVPLVVVHGGAPEVTRWLTRLGIATSFVDGLRVTDAETLKVVTAVLGGLVNKELVLGIQAQEGKAIGISGSDGNLLRAKPMSPRMGYTGEIIATDPTLLKILLKSGYMPVVAPLSLGELEGKPTLLNTNGDTAAGEIAAALGAGKLIFLTDVEGVYDGSGKLISRLNAAGAKEMLAGSAATGGMLPKIEASLKALRATPLVRIINGKTPHALVKEMKNKMGGTSIVPE